MGALAQHGAQFVGQALEPGVGECCPALHAGALQPGDCRVARRPAAALEFGQAGARGDVEQQVDLIALESGGRGEAPGVGQRDPAAGELSRRLLAQGEHQFGHRGERAEGAVAGTAVDEARIGLAHRFQGGRGRTAHQLGARGQAERRPGVQLLDDGIPGGEVAGLLTEQSGGQRDCCALGDLGRGGVERRDQLRGGRRAGGRGQLAGDGDEGQGRPVESLQRGLDRGAVEQCLSQVEEVANALLPNPAFRHQPPESVIVEHAQPGRERECRSAASRHRVRGGRVAVWSPRGRPPAARP